MTNFDTPKYSWERIKQMDLYVSNRLCLYYSLVVFEFTQCNSIQYLSCENGSTIGRRKKIRHEGEEEMEN